MSGAQNHIGRLVSVIARNEGLVWSLSYGYAPEHRILLGTLSLLEHRTILGTLVFFLYLQGTRA